MDSDSSLDFLRLGIRRGSVTAIPLWAGNANGPIRVDLLSSYHSSPDIVKYTSYFAAKLATFHGNSGTTSLTAFAQ